LDLAGINVPGSEEYDASVLAGNDMPLIYELWSFLRSRKKFWLFPVIMMLLALGALLLLAQSSAIAPFIYTLF
jgi:hypothetical protein